MGARSKARKRALDMLYAADLRSQSAIESLETAIADGEGPTKTEIGYWLGRAYWGCGFATEATKAALAWASREWRRRHIMARHFSDNPASGEVLCKAGFLYTGEVRLSRSQARGEAVPSRMMVWLA